MGDSACLMQGNPMRFLGESVSFGRFMNELEPLSWEKWSTFSHKKYVEEAARYAQPGSVAQKKAFFEAHYKKIAAQKAAALLEQQNAEQGVTTMEGAVVILNSHHDDSKSSSIGNEERPLLKESCVGSEDTSSAMSKNKSRSRSTLESSIRRKTWKVPSTPMKPVVTPSFKKENSVIQSAKKTSLESMDKKRQSHRSLRGLINLIPIKEPDKEPVSVAKKDCRTLLRTPIVAAAKVLNKYSASTPLSENRSYTKSLTACRNKLQSPASSTPFTLRTEERAAKRKQKLEEKFSTIEEQKTLKEKAGNELKKLSYSFCFKARPLPNFYKERETPVNQMKKKTPAAQPKTIVLGRSNSKKPPHGVVSMPPPPPPPKSLTKKNAANPSRFHTSSSRENKSPNIQHRPQFAS